MRFTAKLGLLVAMLFLQFPTATAGPDKLSEALAVLKNQKSSKQQIVKALHSINQVEDAWDDERVLDALSLAARYRFEDLVSDIDLEHFVVEAIGNNEKGHSLELINSLYRAAESFDVDIKGHALDCLALTKDGQSSRFKTFALNSLDPMLGPEFLAYNTSHLNPFLDDLDVRVRIIWTMQSLAEARPVPLTKRQRRTQEVFSEPSKAKKSPARIANEIILTNIESNLRFHYEYLDESGRFKPESFPRIAEFLLGRKISEQEVMTLMRAGAKIGGSDAWERGFSKRERRSLLESGLFGTVTGYSCLKELVRKLRQPR